MSTINNNNFIGKRTCCWYVQMQSYRWGYQLEYWL